MNESRRIKRSVVSKHREMGTFPFQKGDRVRITKRPLSWTFVAGGGCGLDEVIYPYEFTVEAVKFGISSDSIGIFDGKYGWSYYPDRFELVKNTSNKFKDKPLQKEQIIKRR